MSGSGIYWPTIAKVAYEAYGKETGNKNFRGEEMPTWEELPEKIQNAWIAAVQEACHWFGIAVSN